jgi:hypothetical protein
LFACGAENGLRATSAEEVLVSLFHKTLAVAVLAAPLAAQATNNTINFAFEQILPVVSSAPTYVSGGLGVTVRGFDSDNNQEKVHIGLKGLGVDSKFLDTGDIGSSLFDNPGEYLTLTFNQQVTLTKLTFGFWEDGFDKATLSWNGNTINLGSNNSGFFLDTFNLTGVTGTTFKIQATGAVSSFKLAGLSAVPAIPEPSTYALMGLGLVGIALAARKRRA